jgi:hypothetical protein
MPLDPLATLRQVNDNVRSALLRLRPEQKHCSTIRPQDFSDMLGELVRAADCLRNLPANLEAGSELEKEIAEYRSNLEKLKQFLPDLHGRLLAERARLQSMRAHVAAAAAWAGASKRTL